MSIDAQIAHRASFCMGRNVSFSYAAKRCTFILCTVCAEQSDKRGTFSVEGVTPLTALVHLCIQLHLPKTVLSLRGVSLVENPLEAVTVKWPPSKTSHETNENG